jgi:hypothetical protein
MNSILLDRLELGFLSGLQDQRSVTKRVRDQTKVGVNRMMGTTPVAVNGVAGETEDDGLNNRCRTTTNHNHTYTPNTGPWIFASVLLLGLLGGLTWLGVARTTPSQAVVTPVTPTTPVIANPAAGTIDVEVIKGPK